MSRTHTCTVVVLTTVRPHTACRRSSLLITISGCSRKYRNTAKGRGWSSSIFCPRHNWRGDNIKRKGPKSTPSRGDTGSDRRWRVRDKASSSKRSQATTKQSQAKPKQSQAKTKRLPLPAKRLLSYILPQQQGAQAGGKIAKPRRKRKPSRGQPTAHSSSNSQARSLDRRRRLRAGWNMSPQGAARDFTPGK